LMPVTSGENMAGMRTVPFTLHNVFTQWSFSIFPLCVLAVLIALGTWYLRADWRLAARGRRWSGYRRLAFFSGLLAIDLAFQSSISVFSNDYFQAHVIQHLTLMVVAPPLLALGAPSTLLLQTASRPTKERWLRTLRSRPFAVISHPLPVWFLYYGVMFVFFLTPLVNVAMWHMGLMDALNVLFLLGGALFWWPMVGLDPIVHWKMSHPARMLNILLGTGIEAFLGVAIIADSHPLASMYTLASTHTGGALLWTSTEAVTLGAFVPIFLQWSHSEERIGARADRAADLRALANIQGMAIAPPESPVASDGVARRLTPWEAEWYARTGFVPRNHGAP
jgi:cytochrome c oxidase assembly factor CtaG